MDQWYTPHDRGVLSHTPHQEIGLSAAFLRSAQHFLATSAGFSVFGITHQRFLQKPPRPRTARSNALICKVRIRFDKILLKACQSHSHRLTWTQIAIGNLHAVFERFRQLMKLRLGQPRTSSMLFPFVGVTALNWDRDPETVAASEGRMPRWCSFADSLDRIEAKAHAAQTPTVYRCRTVADRRFP